MSYPLLEFWKFSELAPPWREVVWASLIIAIKQWWAMLEHWALQFYRAWVRARAFSLKFTNTYLKLAAMLSKVLLLTELIDRCTEIAALSIDILFRNNRNCNNFETVVIIIINNFINIKSQWNALLEVQHF